MTYLNTIIEKIDLNICFAILIVIAIFFFLKYIMPKINKNNKNIYDEVALALELTGAIYKDEDVNKIINAVIKIIESLDGVSEMKGISHTDTVVELAQTIFKELNIEVEEKTTRIIVRIIKAYWELP